jgi:hypothetical protein
MVDAMHAEGIKVFCAHNIYKRQIALSIILKPFFAPNPNRKKAFLSPAELNCINLHILSL